MARTNRVSIIVHQHARTGRVQTDIYPFRDHRDAVHTVMNRISEVLPKFHELGDMSDFRYQWFVSVLASLRNNLNHPMITQFANYHDLLQAWKEATNESFRFTFDAPVLRGPIAIGERK